MRSYEESKESYEPVKGYEESKESYEPVKGYEESKESYEPVKGYEESKESYEPVDSSEESKETYSALLLKTKDFHIIFLYLSNNYDKNCLFSLLEMWIEDDFPTAVLGDINEDLLTLKKMAFSKKMSKKGFHQLIKETTCVTGSLIDHVYANSPMRALGISTEITACYYSDHDIISLFVSKPQ